MTMRVVLDTNVLLSGLLWHGPPHILIERVREGTLFLVSSPALLAELAEVIARAQFAAILARSNTSPERSLAELRLGRSDRARTPVHARVPRPG